MYSLSYFVLPHGIFSEPNRFRVNTQPMTLVHMPRASVHEPWHPHLWCGSPLQQVSEYSPHVLVSLPSCEALHSPFRATWISTPSVALYLCTDPISLSFLCAPCKTPTRASTPLPALRPWGLISLGLYPWCVSSAPKFGSFFILCTLIPVPSTTHRSLTPFHTPSGTGSKPLVKSLTTLYLLGASLVAQMVKNLPAVQETWVQSLGQEDSLEKGMTTHSSILTWRIPWTEEPGRLQFMGSQRVRHDWVTNICTFTFHLLALTKPRSPGGPCSPFLSCSQACVGKPAQTRGGGVSWCAA